MNFIQLYEAVKRGEAARWNKEQLDAARNDCSQLILNNHPHRELALTVRTEIEHILHEMESREAREQANEHHHEAMLLAVTQHGKTQRWAKLSFWAAVILGTGSIIIGCIQILDSRPSEKPPQPPLQFKPVEKPPQAASPNTTISSGSTIGGQNTATNQATNSMHIAPRP